jgi:hypothetical protein
MKQAAMVMVVLMAAVLVVPQFTRGDKAPPASRPASGPAAKEGTVTWTGTFNWTGKRGQTFPITAVLTPAGENAWTAVYNFQWGGNQTFAGEIKRDAQTGAVTGTGNQTKGNRTFAFKGVAKQGVVNFDHMETSKGKTVATGSGTFNLP